MEQIMELGNQFIIWLQGFGDGLNPIMKALSNLGIEEFFILFLVCVWAVNYDLSIKLGIILMLSSGINTFFKTLFALPRPYWVDTQVQNLWGAETGFGLPSGHSQTPFALYGLLAAKIKKRWVTILIAVLIFLIGFSRIMMGVHFPTDVIAGWLIGALLLWLFLKYEDKVSAWFKKNSLANNILAIFLVALVMIAAVSVNKWMHADEPLNSVWMTNSYMVHPEDPINPFNIFGIITPAATLFGLVCGAVWIRSRGGYVQKKDTKHVLLYFFTGLIVALLIKEGLGLLFPRTPDLIGYSFRFLRYALMGFWLIGLAPALFIRLGWAEKGS
jgi:membrane-associated phospholipid phosphatase